MKNRELSHWFDQCDGSLFDIKRQNSLQRERKILQDYYKKIYVLIKETLINIVFTFIIGKDITG